MTRINHGIPVAALSDRLLFAEHRELKRICALYKSGLRTKSNVFVPHGKGHVQYFADKPATTFHRQVQIEVELRNRGMNYTSYLRNWLYAYRDRLTWRDIDSMWVFDDGCVTVPLRKEQLAMASRLLFCIDRAKREFATYRGDKVCKDAQKAILRKWVGSIHETVYKYSKYAETLVGFASQDWLHCRIMPSYPAMGDVIEVFVWDTREVVYREHIQNWIADELRQSLEIANDNGLATTVGKFDYANLALQSNAEHFDYIRDVLPELFDKKFTSK